MVDILLAVYNGERYLSEQIDSILAQSVDQWRLIIQDDGSSDGTIPLVQSYVERYPERMQLFCNEKNSGSPQKNFFSLLKRAESPYVMTCDHDDVWLPNKIERTYAKMVELERSFPGKPVLVHTDLRVVDENLHQLSPSMFESQCLDPKRDGFHQLLVQNIITGCTMMVNRPLLERADRLPVQAIMHDWWLGLIASAFGEIGFVSEPTILYRQHASNQVGAKNVKDLGFIARRMQQGRQIKQVMQDTYDQAGAFLQEFSTQLPQSIRETAEQYAQLPQKSKLGRIRSIFQHDFKKHGLARVLGQIVYI